MKRTFLAVFLFGVLTCCYVKGGNFILTIDGKKHEIDMEKQSIIKLSDGKKINVTLEKKPIVTFKVKNFSLDHFSNFSPARTDLGDGISQTMMSTPIGTLVIVQEYKGLDPSGLIDIMLNELTKEERQYGYKISNSPVNMKLASGKTLKGKKSVSSYKDTETTRHVSSFSVKDGGILVITQINKDTTKKDRDMIQLFWKTFKIKMK